MNINEKYNEQIEELIKNHPKSWVVPLKKKENNHLLEYIFEFTKEFKNLKLPERVYWTLHDLHAYPKCANPNCNKDINHNARCWPLEGYRVDHCCHRCLQNDPNYQQKLRQHFLQTIGYESPSQLPKFKAKMSNIMKNKSQEEKDKSNALRRNTCKRIYGCISVSQLPEVKAKVSQAWKDKPKSEKESITRQRKATKKLNYGNENFTNTELARQTRYANNNGKWEANDTQAKRKQSCFMKYGVDNVMKSNNISKKSINIRTNKQRKIIYDNVIMNDQYVIPMFSRDDYIVHGYTYSYQWKCKKCGKIFQQCIGEHPTKFSRLARCLDCYPLLDKVSMFERDVRNYVEAELQNEIVCNSRDIIPPKELDIYIPLKKIAIECNGVFWHSQNNGTPKDYHLCKSNFCKEKDIQLLHILDCEWNFKPDVVKSNIQRVLSKSSNLYVIKNCKIQQIDFKIANEFYNVNNLRPFQKATLHLGCFMNGQLIAITSFKKLKLGNHFQWHLVNFCEKNFSMTPGCLKAFCDYAKENIKLNLRCIYAIADKSLLQHTRYKSEGFAFVKDCPPNEWYLKIEDKNKKMLENYKMSIAKIKNDFPDISRLELAIKNDYYQYFDAGNELLLFED